jgi:hypothetical protein
VCVPQDGEYFINKVDIINLTLKNMKKTITLLSLMALVFGLSMSFSTTGLTGAKIAEAATPVLTSVTVTPPSPSVAIGGTVQLTANPLDQNNVAFVGATTAFSSGNTAIATVDSSTGLVTGVTAGSATITATSESDNTTVTGTAMIKVTNNNGGGSGTGMISGETYNDLNGNEMKDSGEPGISGFTIKLYNVPGWSGPSNVAPIMTTITDASGNYSFSGLADGTYSVEEVNMASWHQDTGDYSPVVITSGAAITNMDFANSNLAATARGKGNDFKGGGGSYGHYQGNNSGNNGNGNTNIGGNNGNDQGGGNHWNGSNQGGGGNGNGHHNH